jgi:hypothetical protein
VAPQRAEILPTHPVEILGGLEMETAMVVVVPLQMEGAKYLHQVGLAVNLEPMASSPAVVHQVAHMIMVGDSGQ